MKLRIRFDGPPSAEGPRFIEVEDENGQGLHAGTWVEDPNTGDYFLEIETTEFN
uniref:Uncharacterized protein n=4 Tax=unclassified bacterial viruses TaxID=12333 RepID=A0AAU6W0E7_9VIRU